MDVKVWTRHQRDEGSAWKWRHLAACVGAGALLAALPALSTQAHTKATPPRTPIDTSSKEPMTLIVSLTEQRVNIFRGDTQILSSRVSTGQKGYETPPGIFSILQKKKWHRSNIYSAAPMPFMQRITWSGVALHAGVVPNRPASHGCIRLPSDFAPKLFRATDVGAHVLVVRDHVAPEPIEHPALFQPLDSDEPAKSASAPARVQVANAAQQDTMSALPANDAETRMAVPSDPTPTDPGWYGQYRHGSDSPLRVLITRRTGRERLMDVQRVLKELHYSVGDIDGYMGPDTAGAIRSFQENHFMKADGLVTDELIRELYAVAGKGEVVEGHIYVRQDFKKVFDAPLSLRDPEAPLGTHLYIARHFEPGEASVGWLAITPKADAPTTALEALDRVEIPSFVRHMIAGMLTPGSSLIISDDGLSKETFPKGTDFVVLTE